MAYMHRKLIQMRSKRFLPVMFILILANGMIWGQSVHLESGGITITVICHSAGTYQFIGTNNDGIPGTFELFEVGSAIPVTGHITDSDLTDDMALLNPAGLDGVYRVRYSYFNGIATISVTSDFTVAILDDIEIQGLPASFCKNSPPFRLIPVPSLSDPAASYSFSGPGVSGNQSVGYYYNPASSQVAEGWIDIYLNYNASNGCQSMVTYSIYNAFVPTISFTTTSSCIPTDGGVVKFNNLSTGKYSVESWKWTFGDPGSGANNVSSEENPEHLYPFPGIWNVRLEATTFEGCQASQTQNVVLSDEPDVDFTWINDCFIRGELTSFLDRTESPYAVIDELQWTFRTTGGGVLGQISSTSPKDTIDFPFTSLNDYNVTLEVQNQLGCGGSKTKTISFKPIYELTGDGYLEKFDDQPADWLVNSETGLESWVIAEPDFNGFQPVTGDLAWYTDLPDNSEYLENSWVQSPCLDLSVFSKLMVQVDIMKSFVPGTDGAVLQYQRNVSDGWKTIGTVNEGINWYNSYGIFNKPGGSSFGWGLSLFEPDTKWVGAGYAIDALAGAPYIKFRMAIGTGGAVSMGNQGFAFDNFFLGERIKHSILEYFTNSASSDAIEADGVVEQFAADYSGLVTDLQYHMDYPGEDPMNLNNPVPPSVRSFNYGVPSVPYAVLDGGSGPDNRFDFSSPSEQPNGEALMASSLGIPAFEVNLTADFLANLVTGNVKVTCREDGFDSNIQLYVVVVEQLVTAYTGAGGATTFRNVVLDILPSATGKLLGNVWGEGISKDLDFSWNYASYVEDLEDLMLVAYVLDRDHDMILHSKTLAFTPAVGFENRAADDEALSIYPNPAEEFVYINFGSKVLHEGQLRIIDLAGRPVLTSEVLPGYSIQQLDISKLAQGVYLVSWIESGLIKGRGKLIHSR
jgi:hypothetical protein